MMPPVINFVAGIVCLALTINFFRMGFQREAPAEAIAAAPPAVKCVPSGDLLNISKDDLMGRCGTPRSINHQMIAGGAVRKEQWSYRDPVFYVYLSNDRVDSIQYAENGQNFEWKN
jgi:hypothetical protein